MKLAEYRNLYPEFVAEVHGAKWRGLRFLGKLEALRRPTTKKERNSRRHLTRLALRNPDLRLWCAFRGVKGADRLADFPPDQIIALTAMTDPWRPLDESIRTKRQVKRGKLRELDDFGPKARARQLLVGEVLKANHDPHPFQFRLKGGVPAALQAVEEAIREGFRFGKEVDIANFYPNIRLESFYVLLSPLPGAVIKHTVMKSGHVDKPATGSFSLQADREQPSLTRGSRGLSQGSACSNVAAEMLMTEFLRALPYGVRAISFGDNVMLLGLNAKDVEQGTTVFAERLQAHACGSLVLKGQDSPILDLYADHFRFLRQTGKSEFDDDRGVRIIAWEPEHHKLEDIEREIESDKSSRETLEATIRRVKGWRGGYKCWTGREQWMALRLAQLKAKLLCMTSGIEMSTLAREIVVHWGELGFHVPIEDILPCPDWRGYDEARTAIQRRKCLSSPDRKVATLP